MNPVRSFQIETGAARRPRTLKRTFDDVFQSLVTVRFELIHQPGRLTGSEGRLQLRFAVSPRARGLFRRCQRAVEHDSAAASPPATLRRVRILSDPG